MFYMFYPNMMQRQLYMCATLKDKIVSERQPRRFFKQKDRLTMWGRYFDKVCQRLHVTWDQVAQEAGLDPSTLSKAAKGRNSPQYGTVDKIVRALMPHPGYLHNYKRSLFNLARHATPEQYEEAVHDYYYMDYVDKTRESEQAPQMEQQK